MIWGTTLVLTYISNKKRGRWNGVPCTYTRTPFRKKCQRVQGFETPHPGWWNSIKKGCGHLEVLRTVRLTNVSRRLPHPTYSTNSYSLGFDRLESFDHLLVLHFPYRTEGLSLMPLRGESSFIVLRLLTWLFLRTPIQLTAKQWRVSSSMFDLQPYCILAWTALLTSSTVSSLTKLLALTPFVEFHSIPCRPSIFWPGVSKCTLVALMVVAEEDQPQTVFLSSQKLCMPFLLSLPANTVISSPSIFFFLSICEGK